jgi:anaerobic ribonucleoside-triphosphate reductase activating protein
MPGGPEMGTGSGAAVNMPLWPGSGAASGDPLLRADARLQVSGVVEESIVDGPGLRYVVFTQGCPHGCPGCHNPQTHSLSGGHSLSVSSVLAAVRENPLLAGITFSGGEPFLQPGPLCLLAEGVRALGGTVVVYSGYTLEALLDQAAARPATARLLRLTDLLIDGPYVVSLRDLDLPFRGSRNQRILGREAILAALGKKIPRRGCRQP